MFEMRNRRAFPNFAIACAALAAAAMVNVGPARAASTLPPAAAKPGAPAEHPDFEDASNQVGSLLSLDAAIAEEKMRKAAGIPTESEKRAQQERSAAVQQEQKRLAAPVAPPKPRVEALYGVGANLTAVVSYGGELLEFRAGQKYAVGKAGGPRLKSIGGRCVRFSGGGSVHRACFQRDPDIRPGPPPRLYGGATPAAPQDSTGRTGAAQFGVVPPPPPFLTR